MSDKPYEITGQSSYNDGGSAQFPSVTPRVLYITSGSGTILFKNGVEIQHIMLVGGGGGGCGGNPGYGGGFVESSNIKSSGSYQFSVGEGGKSNNNGTNTKFTGLMVYGGSAGNSSSYYQGFKSSFNNLYYCGTGGKTDWYGSYSAPLGGGGGYGGYGWQKEISPISNGGSGGGISNTLKPQPTPGTEGTGGLAGNNSNGSPGTSSIMYGGGGGGGGGGGDYNYNGGAGGSGVSDEVGGGNAGSAAIYGYATDQGSNMYFPGAGAGGNGGSNTGGGGGGGGQPFFFASGYNPAQGNGGPGGDGGSGLIMIVYNYVPPVPTGFTTSEGDYENTDLVDIFQPLGTGKKLDYNVGYKPNQTNYQVNDLTDIFLPNVSAISKGNVGMSYLLTDLSYFFEPLGQSEVGIVWNARSFGSFVHNRTGWGGSYFLISGSEGVQIIYDNGAWTSSIGIPTGTETQGVAGNTDGTIFCAGINSIYTSTDGVNYIETYNGGGILIDMKWTDYEGGRFVVCDLSGGKGTRGGIWSSDGYSWHEWFTPINEGEWESLATNGSGEWLCITTGSDMQVIKSIDNGEYWDSVTSIISGGSNDPDIAYGLIDGSPAYMVVCDSGVWVTKDSGTNWNKTNSSEWSGVVYCPTQSFWVLVNNSSSIYTTPNGINFTSRVVNNASPQYITYNPILDKLCGAAGGNQAYYWTSI
jgi:hypothetical protein